MYKQRSALKEAQSFSDYWEQWLLRTSLEERLAACEGSRLWRTFQKHLPKGRCLEAGCGVGQWVMFLRKHGYDVEGVEYRGSAIQTALQSDPDLPVRVGDVRCLDVEDGTYDAYISLGVIEHFEDGPEELLAEARRVTKGPEQGGRLLISVPLHTPLTEKAARRRERQEGVGCKGGSVGEVRFFQYLFSPSDYQALLERNGLRLIDLDYYDSYSTLALLSPGLYRKASESGLSAYPAKALARGLLNYTPAPLVSHMQMAICVKA